jgi:hypothetical protein
MQVDLRPALPARPRQVPAFRSGRDRLQRWVATTVTALTALIAILFVSLVSLWLA